MPDFDPDALSANLILDQILLAEQNGHEIVPDVSNSSGCWAYWCTGCGTFAFIFRQPKKSSFRLYLGKVGFEGRCGIDPPLSPQEVWVGEPMITSTYGWSWSTDWGFDDQTSSYWASAWAWT